MHLAVVVCRKAVKRADKRLDLIEAPMSWVYEGSDICVVAIAQGDVPPGRYSVRVHLVDGGRNRVGPERSQSLVVPPGARASAATWAYLEYRIAEGLGAFYVIAEIEKIGEDENLETIAQAEVVIQVDPRPPESFPP